MTDSTLRERIDELLETPRKTLEGFTIASLGVDAAQAVYDGFAALADELEALIGSEVAQARTAAIGPLFDQSGCDCDSAFEGEHWNAPYHAGDCPVYERWSAHEGDLEHAR